MNGQLVPPAGSPPHISTAQLPAERTGEPPEYAGYEGRLAGTPSRNLDPPIYATDFRRGALTALRIPGTVRRVVPLGGVTRVDVGTAAGILACLAPGADGLAPGCSAAVTVAEQHLRRLTSG